MNNLRNKVQLIGHLGGDPEVKTFNEGRKLAKFSLATNETFKNGKGEKIKETQWHNLICWGSTAGFAEKYLKKGLEVAVEGKLVNRTYTGKDGLKRYVTDVEVNDVLIITKKNT